jgi:hypothetical protein
MSYSYLSSGSGLVVQPVIPASISEIPNEYEKPVVFLTSVRISDDHIWANGLFQNVYVIYKMFEVMGCVPWMLVDNNENNKDAKIHNNFRMTDFKTYIQKPFKVHYYIEIAMSCDPGIRKFFKNMGTKISKLYLGNILNIDIETVSFYKQTNFSHHVAGEIDEIWTSPHYDQHADYTGSINGLCGKVRIAPYLWDPLFIEPLGKVYDGAPFHESSPRLFVIMEPNISFQKNCLIPILALEAYYRKYPERVEQIIVVNGEKFKNTPWFMDNIASTLQIMKDNKLQLMPRAHMKNAAQAFKHAIILQHQVNNEYNYSLLEWLTMGFPVVHNVSRLKSYGYYYEGNDFYGVTDLLTTITSKHQQCQAAYEAKTKQLLWNFSIHNPSNIKGWKELVFSKPTNI